MILQQINSFELVGKFTAKFVVITSLLGMITGLGSLFGILYLEILGGFIILIAGIGHFVLGVINLMRLCFLPHLFKEHLFSLYLISLNIAHATAWLYIISL